MKTYILGSGAIGSTLAACLAGEGREVVAVRTSPEHDFPAQTVGVTVHGPEGDLLETEVEAISLSRLASLDGLLVVAAKSHANERLAQALAAKRASGPVVVMQNGLGVERPFVEAGFPQVLRCVLYATAQVEAPGSIRFRPVASSPIGIVQGGDADAVAAALSTRRFAFHAEARIEVDVWRKAILNAAFNSICPLLEIDNGVFARDEGALALAREVVAEGAALAARQGVDLGEAALVEHLLKISRSSDGQLISTLQDLRAGRPTEIGNLNIEMERLASTLEPKAEVARIGMLGRLVLAKERLTSGRR